MRMDQSGTRAGDSCQYKPGPLWLTVYSFCFHRRLKAVSPWLSWNADDVSPEQRRADQCSAKQTGSEQSRPSRSQAELPSLREPWPQDSLALGQPGPRAVLQPRYFHSCAVSRLSCPTDVAVLTAILYHNWAVLH